MTTSSNSYNFHGDFDGKANCESPSVSDHSYDGTPHTDLAIDITNDSSVAVSMRICRTCCVPVALSAYYPSAVKSGSKQCKQCSKIASKLASSNGKVRKMRNPRTPFLKAVQKRMHQVYGVKTPGWAMSNCILNDVFEKCEFKSAISGIRRCLILVQTTHNSSLEHPNDDISDTGPICTAWTPSDSMCVTVGEAADIAIMRSLNMPIASLLRASQLGATCREQSDIVMC
jgi:hypothetical protein